MALRLEQAGLEGFLHLSLFRSRDARRWRGYEGEMLWKTGDGRLDVGETLDQVLAAAPDASLLYVDPKRQKIICPVKM